MLVSKPITFLDYLGQLITLEKNGRQQMVYLMGQNEGGIFIQERGGQGLVKYVTYPMFDEIYFPKGT